MSETFEVKILPEAISDIDEIRSYIRGELGADAAAARVGDGILGTIGGLRTLPRRNRVIAANGTRELRRARYGNYAIVYEVIEQTVTVLAVLYGKRDIANRLSGLL